jgi:hypothetical protein
MGDIKFNVSKSQIGYYVSLPATNDALIAVVLEATGLESDNTLTDYATLSALLAAANNEQTTMGRKTLSSVAEALVGTGLTATRDSSAADIVWVDATGAATGAVVICYDPDTTTGTDADLIPLSKHDFIQTPSGVSLSFQLSSAFLRVS